MRAGPKAATSLKPLDLSPLPERGGLRVIAFIEKFIRVPVGTGVGKPMVLLPFQRQIIRELFDEPRRYRQGLMSIPRGNGKTSLCAAIALYALLADRVEGAEVLVVARDERQARVLLNKARRMCELEPRLMRHVQVFQDKIYCPSTDSTLEALPSEAGSLLGRNPSLMLIDELAVVDERTWEAVSSAAGKRVRSLTLAISTPPENQDSVMYRLREHALEGADPSFWYCEFSAPDGCSIDDEGAWKIGNPALGHFLHIEGLRANRRTIREAVFRRQRLGQHVYGAEQWVTGEQWKACADPLREIPAGAEVVLGFDGSFSGDCTGLVAVSCDPRPHLQVVELWEKVEADPNWRVDILEVEERIRQACKFWKVREVIADPYRWARSLQLLADERLPVHEFPQSSAMMIPATNRFYEAIVNKTLTHSGDSRLTRHIANCVLRIDARGTRLSKSHKSSTRHIDLAVCAVMALDRASLQLASYDLLQSIW